MDDLVKEYPKDTVVNSIASPSIKALIELNRNNAAQALQLLEPSRRFDLGSIVGFRNNYLRGLAYLDMKQGTDAAKEFQIILDHPTTDPFSPLYSLAHLGLGRAAVLNGDVAKARTAYQDFLVAWKDGDQNLAVLEQAKKEYDALK
jgi:predicted Zn-dependent protease